MEKYDGDKKPECVIEDVSLFDANDQKLDFDSFVKRKLKANSEKQKIDWMLEEMELSLIFAFAKIKYYVSGFQEVVLKVNDIDIIKDNIEKLKQMDVKEKNRLLLQLRLEDIKNTLKNAQNRPHELKLREEKDFLISVLKRTK